MANSRRGVLKAAPGLALGVAGLVGTSGSAAATHQFHTTGPYSEEADGNVTFETGASTYEPTHSDALVPLGVMWHVEQSCGGLTWYEVRNLTITIDPADGNPSEGALYAADPWDDADEESPPDSLDVLENLAWEFMPTTFSIFNAVNDDSIDQWTVDDDGGEQVKVRWNGSFRCSKHGGVDVAWWLDPDGHPANGRYWFETSVEADVWYITSTGSSKVDEVSIYNWIDTYYED